MYRASPQNVRGPSRAPFNNYSCELPYNQGYKYGNRSYPARERDDCDYEYGVNTQNCYFPLRDREVLLIMVLMNMGIEIMNPTGQVHLGSTLIDLMTAIKNNIIGVFQDPIKG